MQVWGRLQLKAEPPGIRDGQCIARLRLRSTKRVPVCEPMRGLVPMRYPVAPAANDAVQSLARGHQSRPAVGCNHTLDQRINDRVRDAAHILRSLHGGGSRGEEGPQCISRRTGEAEPLHDDIEIEIVHTFAVLHGVDDAHAGLNAQRPETLDEGIVMRQRNGIIDEEFDGERFALWRHALAVLDDASGLL